MCNISRKLIHAWMHKMLYMILSELCIIYYIISCFVPVNTKLYIYIPKYIYMEKERDIYININIFTEVQVYLIR